MSIDIVIVVIILYKNTINTKLCTPVATCVFPELMKLFIYV